MKKLLFLLFLSVSVNAGSPGWPVIIWDAACASGAYNLAAQTCLVAGGGGVSSLNGLTGALTLIPGTNITITPSGSNITISSTSSGISSINGDTTAAQLLTGANGVTAVTTSGNTVISIPSPIPSTLVGPLPYLPLAGGALSGALTSSSTASFSNGNWTVDSSGNIIQAGNFQASGVINDNTGAQSINQNTRVLYDSDGSTAALSWDDGSGNMTLSPPTAIYFNAPTYAQTIFNISAPSITHSINFQDTYGNLITNSNSGWTVDGEMNLTGGFELPNVNSLIYTDSGGNSNGLTAGIAGNVPYDTGSGWSKELAFKVSELSSQTLTGKTASIGTTNIATPSATHAYTIHYYLFYTTAGTSGTVSAAFGWTDTTSTVRSAASSAITAGTLTFTSGTIEVLTKASSNITYATTVTSFVGSPVYALYFWIVQGQ